jgi:alkaline phosphatase D
MMVEFATNSKFENSTLVQGSTATPSSDLTAKTVLRELPVGERIFVRVSFRDLADPRKESLPVEGQFNVPAVEARDVRFLWSGDTAGQGFGINPEFGGMRIYDTMRRFEPDFFIHCGDSVYADVPILPEIKLEDGSIWRNVTTPEKLVVAQSLEEFRGNYRYNLQDEHVRRFNAAVPLYSTWDDHEVYNNWAPGGTLSDPRYSERSADLLAARGKKAFFEYTPIASTVESTERIYRSFRYGPALEIFRLDERSYRGANTPGRESDTTPTPWLGESQSRWLKESLRDSTATWKIIVSDMPLGLIVPDGKNVDAAANGDGPPTGREREVADILGYLKAVGVKNVIWLTADVHYAAAHFYDPERAQFKNFDSFWEFVGGPLHAGTFGPNKLDDTFGPEAKFVSVPEGLKPNRPPTEGLQFFGQVKLDGETEALTVSLHNLVGAKLYSVELIPEKK